MSGYYNYSMSNNAIAAYESGEKPLSKWKKSEIIEGIKTAIDENDLKRQFKFELLAKLTTVELKNLVLTRSSWHHTSNYFNKTDFYKIDVEKIEKITNSQIDKILAEHKKTKKEKTDVETPIKWRCSFLVWSGTRKHPKAESITAIGYIKGSWFYLPDGTKKNIYANGFKQIERIN